MKLMKSGIEVDAKKQEKIKGGYCVCYCDIGQITANSENFGVEGDSCGCTCDIESTIYAHERLKRY